MIRLLTAYFPKETNASSCRWMPTRGEMKPNLQHAQSHAFAPPTNSRGADAWVLEKQTSYLDTFGSYFQVHTPNWDTKDCYLLPEDCCTTTHYNVACKTVSANRLASYPCHLVQLGCTLGWSAHYIPFGIAPDRKWLSSQCSCIGRWVEEQVRAGIVIPRYQGCSLLRAQQPPRHSLISNSTFQRPHPSHEVATLSSRLFLVVLFPSVSDYLPLYLRPLHTNLTYQRCRGGDMVLFKSVISICKVLRCDSMNNNLCYFFIFKLRINAHELLKP